MPLGRVSDHLSTPTPAEGAITSLDYCDTWDKLNASQVEAHQHLDAHYCLLRG